MDNFNLNIDPRQVVEQDEDFAVFAADTLLLATLLDTENAPMLIGSLHSFYTIGMTAEQVAEWIQNVKRFNPPKDKA